MNDDLQRHRDFLVEAEQQVQDDFDKAVLSLSGGALGISFAFVRDIVGDQPLVSPELLFASWMAWGVSILFILVSIFTSQYAFGQAIKQIDNRVANARTAGGWWSTVTEWLSLLAGVAFFAGVVLIAIFVYSNLR